MSEKAKPKRPFQTHFTGHSLTKKQYGQYVGAKNIIKNNGYQQHITSINVNSDHPVVEWDESNTLHNRLNISKQLDRRFNELSREARKHYETPEKLITALQDPKNWEEAVKMGVLPKDILPKEPTPEIIQKVEIVEKKQPEPEKKGQAAV